MLLEVHLLKQMNLLIAPEKKNVKKRMTRDEVIFCF